MSFWGVFFWICYSVREPLTFFIVMQRNSRVCFLNIVNLRKKGWACWIKSSSCQRAGGMGSSRSDRHTDVGMIQHHSVYVGPGRRCTRSHQPPSVALVSKCPALAKNTDKKLCQTRVLVLCGSFRPQRTPILLPYQFSLHSCLLQQPVWLLNRLIIPVHHGRGCPVSVSHRFDSKELYWHGKQTVEQFRNETKEKQQSATQKRENTKWNVSYPSLRSP